VSCKTVLYRLNLSNLLLAEALCIASSWVHKRSRGLKLFWKSRVRKFYSLSSTSFFRHRL
ncbi:MAG: hypothetical protein ACK56F_29345, partial [bacterium]